MVAARSDDDLFAPNYDVLLHSGGVILVVAFLLAAAGLALFLVGSRELASDHNNPQPLPPPALGPPLPGRLVGLGGRVAHLRDRGFFSFFTGRTGRGLAVAGLVLGIVVLSLYGLPLLLSALFAGPS